MTGRIVSTGAEEGAGLTPHARAVAWVRREIVPPLVASFRPERVVVFDAPDRAADAGDRPPGLLVVAPAFHGVAVPERVALVKAALADAAPVRPLCLTPEEYAVSASVPGPVIAAARAGTRVV